MIFSLRYTNDMKPNQAGYARAWFIRIRPEYKDDKGIHEKVKVKYANQTL